MKRVVVVLSAALLAAAGALASPSASRPPHRSAYKAAYFAATVPGAWSRYAVTTDGRSESAYTYKRLADEDGRPQVEIRADFTAGQFQGTWSTTRYVLSKDFRFDEDALSYAKHCRRLFMRSDKMEEEQELPAATLPNIVAAGIDYAASVAYVGKETIDGRECDHYTYHYVTREKNRTTFDGEVWMNPTVPFGLVREAAKIRTKVGPGSKYSMTLAAVGRDGAGEPSSK